MDEKNKTSSSKKEQDIPINNLKKEHPIGMSFNSWHNEETGFWFDILVTVYWNYIGDNGGMLLNPQKFYSSMPLIFGPNECNLVLKNIFDSCIQCSFQPTSFINRILDLFSSLNDKKTNSSIQIKCIVLKI